jgi:hypothetical protein
MLAPGVVSQRWYPQLGATELLLVNGMRVTVKTTDYFRDEVLITGVAPGGLSEVRGSGLSIQEIFRSDRGLVLGV